MKSYLKTKPQHLKTMDDLKNTIIAFLIAIALLCSCKTSYVENDWEYPDVEIITNDYEDADVIKPDTIPDSIAEKHKI